jgi:hypothetical protein
MTTSPPAVPAPTALPMNLTSIIRLVLGLAGGYLVKAGDLTPTNLQTLIGAVLIIIALIWNIYKNTNVVRELTAALQAPPVTLILGNGTKVPPPVAVLFLPLFAAAAILGGGMSLVACTSVGTPSAATQVALAKTEYAAEVAYNLAGNAYLAAEDYLSPSQKTTVKGYLATAYTALLAARNAEAIGDSTTLAAQVTALQNLAGEVTAITSPVTPPAAAPATPATTSENDRIAGHIALGSLVDAAFISNSR